MSNKLNGVHYDEKSNSQVPESRQTTSEWEWWVSFHFFVVLCCFLLPCAALRSAESGSISFVRSLINYQWETLFWRVWISWTDQASLMLQLMSNNQQNVPLISFLTRVAFGTANNKLDPLEIKKLTTKLRYTRSYHYNNRAAQQWLGRFRRNWFSH